MSESQAKSPFQEEEIDLLEQIRTLWAGKMLIVLCTLVVTTGAVAYALLASEVYRAQASIQIREENGSALASQVGGLAALAGISVGTRDKNRDLALTALKSRAVIQRMIEEEELLPILYAEEWDAANSRWLAPTPPTPWRAYQQFVSNILKVTVDRNSGMVTVAIEWKDPILAATWVEKLITRVNGFVNEATIREAEQNLEFLDQQIRTTTVLDLQKTIYSLKESEISRLMVARNPETAPLRVIDPAVVPEDSVRPRRALTVMLGALVGVLLGGAIVLIRAAARK